MSIGASSSCSWVTRTRELLAIPLWQPLETFRTNTVVANSEYCTLRLVWWAEVALNDVAAQCLEIVKQHWTELFRRWRTPFMFYVLYSEWLAIARQQNKKNYLVNERVIFIMRCLRFYVILEIIVNYMPSIEWRLERECLDQQIENS